MSFTRTQIPSFMMHNYDPLPVMPEKASGSHVWDEDGKMYIDFAAGIATCGLGHCHPILVKALEQQAGKLWHISNIYRNKPALELAQALCAATFADRVFFSNSGAEANEAALKLARLYQHRNHGEGKSTILAFNQAFHGRTLWTVSVGGQPRYRDGLQPLPPGIEHSPFNDIEALNSVFGDHIAAVIVEPIQGESGVLPADAAFLQALRDLCDQKQALLIFDEVQTGMGRTGSLYAYMESGVTPDILTSAKTLGNGFPVAATMASSDVASVFTPGSHGSTLGGNPLACAVAGAALSTINDPDFLSGVRLKSQWVTDELRQLSERYGVFTPPRGRGLLIGCPFTQRYQGQARNFMRIALEAGVMVLAAGPDVLRLTPALNIPEADIMEGMKRLGQACLQLERVV